MPREARCGSRDETMVNQLDAAVGPAVDKRRDVATQPDGKDVHLAFSQHFYVGFSS